MPARQVMGPGSTLCAIIGSDVALEYSSDECT